jgi:hypothetical protein
MARNVSRRGFLHLAATGAIAGGLTGGRSLLGAAQAGPSPGDWRFNATVIEACSCTMFCPCYFSTVPSAHGHGAMAQHFCRFNMGYRVNAGRFAGTSLDGLHFWIAGDLGADFSKGAEWAEVTFAPAATKAQRDAIAAILPHVYPVTWKSFTIGADAEIEWAASGDRARATLAGGRVAEVRLTRHPGMTADPVVIHNLRYFGAPRNTGFVLMPNDVNAYRTGAKPFEFHRTNGFMITYDIRYKMWRIQGERMEPFVAQRPQDGGPPWHSRQYQTLPPVYVQNASLEIAWTRVVTELRSISGDAIAPFLTEGDEGFDINNMEEWWIAQHMVESGHGTLPEVDQAPFPARRLAS